MAREARLVEETRAASAPLRTADDLDPVLDRLGDRRVVLLGEATHGTSEFYTWRRWLTERLVEEKGFSFVAVEGDWPDCQRVDRHVRLGHDGSAREVLDAFARWPTWMWANREVQGLVEWMRGRNEGVREEARVGFHGLDVYSLWDSMRAVAEWVRRERPEAEDAALRALSCFEPYAEDAQAYASSTRWVPEDCADEVAELLARFRTIPRPEAPFAAREERFEAEQNALVARNAEAYYRAMVRGGAESWNVRDRHMMETLERLLDHYGAGSKAVVWAHNTHVGDARATDMASEGMVNLGQLAREGHGDAEVGIVGFSTNRGEVVAARAWEWPMRRMRVPAARRDSWEDVLARAGGDRIVLTDGFGRESPAWDVRGHRAIGVVYAPEREAWGNYVPTVLPARYDALLHVDATRAVEPLHGPLAPEVEPAETWPWGV